MSLLNFDPHQFAGPANRQRPVHAEFDGHDFQSNGLSFQDYGSMQVQTHKLNSGRHGAAPDWVFNDTKLRAVIVGCIEARAFAGRLKTYKPTGPDPVRLARAQQVLSAARPNLEARIDKLCRAFLDAKWSGRAADEKELAQKVEEVDTQLRLLDSPAKYYAGVCYHYWRSGLNSVETGQQLGIKPPHVRGMLWRMGKIAGQLGYGARKIIVPRTPKPPKPQQTDEAKAIVEKQRRSKISAALKGKPRPKALHRTKLIPRDQRLPLVRKMYGKTSNGEIAQALGWAKDARGQQVGYGMVKRLAIQAGLRAA